MMPHVIVFIHKEARSFCLVTLIKCYKSSLFFKSILNMKTHINTLYFSETLKRIGQAETSPKQASQSYGILL